MSATPSEDARTTPNGFFCSRHSAIISLYRGSKMCSGNGTPGSSTSSSGKIGNSELTASPVQTILRHWQAAEKLDLAPDFGWRSASALR
jgi:hypothetical protein